MMTTSGKVARRVRRARNRFFRRNDFEGSRAAVEKALSRLVAGGDLVRVRNGLYWRGTETPLGMAPPNPREVVRTLAGTAVSGPAGLSASNFLGLSTQVPRLPEYAVSGAVPDVDRIRIVRRDGRRGEARRAARLTESDIAVLEVLDSWEKVVELPAGEAMERLSVRLQNDPDSTDRLIRAAQHEPARVRVRMRFLLNAAGRPDLADRVPAASATSVEERALAPLRLVFE
ncbi:MAG: DUF6088 family protein [Acidimicrobiia bacterium]|nr:DUF6088 family protein [Acidimicrobiia bacterium]